MKKVLASLLLLAGLTAVSSCEDDKETVVAPTNMLTVTGTLSGAQQVPPVPTPGTGSVSGSFNTTTNELSYTITYSGLTGAPVAGHFHIAPPGQANPTPTLGLAGLSTPITAKATLTVPQREALLAGNLYANLHTAAYGSGEVRANLTAK